MTKLIPFNTRFGLIDDFRREMDQLFDRFFQDENGGESSQPSTWTPRLNLSESENAYEVTVDLPGLKPGDVNVELRHGDLWISGAREGESGETGRTWHRIERFCGQFHRVVRLGDDVEPEHVEARYQDGVLHVTVPKTETTRTKRIEIKS